MNGLGQRLAQRTWWTGAIALGLSAALAVPLAGTASGGLAPMAVAAVAAAFVGVPLATVEWREEPLDGAAPHHGAGGAVALGRAGAAVSAIGNLWSLLAVGAATAPLLAGAAWSAWVAVVASWLLIGLVSRRAGSLLAAGLAGILLAVAAGKLLVAPTGAPPWTLLEPHWETWRGWIAPAVVAGIVLPAAGLGQWSGQPAVPGAGRAPWVAAGGGLLVAVAIAVTQAIAYEESAGPATSAPAVVMTLLACAAGAAAILARPGPPSLAGQGPVAWRHVAGGILATWWFAGPAAGALALWQSSLLPLGPAVLAAFLAVRGRGARRWSTAGAAVLLVVAAILGWPGLPKTASAAAAAAAILVAAVWIAGTRAVLRAPREVL